MNEKKTRQDMCEYGNHPQNRSRSCLYSDPKNGFDAEVTICPACYAKHVLKYYPESKMAQYIDQHPDEFKK